MGKWPLPALSFLCLLAWLAEARGGSAHSPTSQQTIFFQAQHTTRCTVWITYPGVAFTQHLKHSASCKACFLAGVWHNRNWQVSLGDDRIRPVLNQEYKIWIPSELCSVSRPCGFQKHRAGTEQNSSCQGEFPYMVYLTNSLGNTV